MIHVKNFIDKVHTAKRSNQTKIILDIADAEKLSSDLSKLMADYISHSQLSQKLQSEIDNLTIDMDGGNWK